MEYILEEHFLSEAIYNYLESNSYYPTLLRPQKRKPDNMITGNRWKIAPNIEIEADIWYHKIEVNTREHFSVYGLQDIPAKMDLEWYKGEALITTYELDELLATKLRALYQRKKGRDLFDLWYALNNAEVNVDKVIKAFRHYMNAEGNRVTQK